MIQGMAVDGSMWRETQILFHPEIFIKSYKKF